MTTVHLCDLCENREEKVMSMLHLVGTKELIINDICEECQNQIEEKIEELRQ